MILNDIRYLVGIHLAEKGLPPTVIAPVLNILNMVDTHIVTIGLNMPLEIQKEADRLNYAIVLLNQEEDDAEDSEIEEMYEEEPVVEDDEEEDEDYDFDDDDMN